jgi:nicotinamidase-related amidase
MRTIQALILSTCALAVGCAGTGETIDFHTRSRQSIADGRIEVHEETVHWRTGETAIVICDMWDDHWCGGAARRVGELAGPLNAMLESARERGIFIIHAPSSVVAFYEGSPQRERAQAAAFAPTPAPLSNAERWGTTWCWPEPDREPGMPVDDSDMGCDCDDKCEIRDAWTRQIATIRIDESDAVTDDGQETQNLLTERGIDNVILVGVHLNMCVLGRPFGIRQMVNMDKNVLLMRDMTDTMYDHRMRPFVDHFAGTDLVVAHVEQHWCASVSSTDLTGKPAFRFAEDRREDSEE